MEAILLLRRNPQTKWDAKMMAKRLYLSEKRAGEVLSELGRAGFGTVQEGNIPLYNYSPVSLGLEGTLNQIAELYKKSNRNRSIDSFQDEQAGPGIWRRLQMVKGTIPWQRYLRAVHVHSFRLRLAPP